MVNSYFLVLTRDFLELVGLKLRKGIITSCWRNLSSVKQTLVSQLAKWKSSELAKDLAITNPPSPVYTSDDHSFPFPFSHTSAISKTSQRASTTTRGENFFPSSSSSSSRSQQNKPVALSAGGSVPSSRRKIFLPCWLIQWVTPPPFHFLPLHSSPLPCYSPSALSSRHFTFSVHFLFRHEEFS